MTLVVKKTQTMTPFWPKASRPVFMGVINLTPDSFSDGGLYLKPNAACEMLELWSHSAFIFPDFGAQSTAPQNQGLSFEEEWARILSFLDEIDFETLQKFHLLSFDTYRPQTMKNILAHSKVHKFSGHVLWNDVSGHFDDQVYELLLDHDKLSYVYTHNAVHSRELTPRHREFASLFDPETILETVTREFEGVLGELEDEMRERVILDPGFGFAKDPEVSAQLLKDLPELMTRFNHNQLWLIGLSRKSVLQKMRSSKNWDELDLLQAKEIKSLLNRLSDHRFIFRVHDPLPLSENLL